MGQWAEREARQQTASFFTDLQRTDAPTGRAVGCMRGGQQGGGVNALTFSVEPGLRRSNSLHKTTPSFKELWRNASGSEMVFFGDSSTPSVINHVTVCSAEFMSSRNKSCSPPQKKATVFGFSAACRPGYAVICALRRGTQRILQRGCDEKQKEKKGERLRKTHHHRVDTEDGELVEIQ